MAIVGYKRVSSEDQNLDRQDFDADIFFEEKISGKTKDRPKLLEMIRYVRTGDTVRVFSLDRLGRSLIDLHAIVNEILEKGADVHFIKENLRLSQNRSDPMSTLMFNIFGSFAEFEREIIRERQREGIEKAKAKGVYKGRKRKYRYSIQEAKRLRDEGMSYSKIAKQLGCNVATLFSDLNPDRRQANPILSELF
jgi:DNA invertase Pin-like site-specific DNA recombinase